MKDTITKYIATITMGDEYHKEGEEHLVSENLVERTQQSGLELEVGENKFLNITNNSSFIFTIFYIFKKKI